MRWRDREQETSNEGRIRETEKGQRERKKEHRRLRFLDERRHLRDMVKDALLEGIEI